MKGITFIRVLDESISPVAAVKAIFKKIKSSGMLSTRFAARIIPIERTCYAHLEDVIAIVSEEIKKHYTMVAAAVMQLTHAHWLYGCTGRNLDILARQPIWDMDIDYQCGTGHGVGYILNVHEGPQNMRWRFTGGMVEAVFEDGMDITNEPGIYIQGSHGIRIENVMLAKNDVNN